MFEPDQTELDVVVLRSEVQHEMVLASIVHAEQAPLFVDLVVESERVDEAPIEFRIGDRKVGRELRVRDGFGEGDRILLESFGRADAVGRCSEVDLRQLLGFQRGDPRCPRADLFDEEVVLEADRQAVVDVVVGGKPRAWPLLRHIGVAISDHPFFVKAPRTEELAFARSPGSGGDAGLAESQNGHRCEGYEDG